jgi:hypothetical protein
MGGRHMLGSRSKMVFELGGAYGQASFMENASGFRKFA